MREHELIRHFDENEPPKTAVLMSGGLDSAVLAGELCRKGVRVFPLYVRFGLRWETVELDCVRRFVAALDHPLMDRVTVLEAPMTDTYSGHWSLAGTVPDANSPDEAVYLPGRNVLLVSKAAIWCSLNGVRSIHSGVLKGNPFPDASAPFFETLAQAISMGLQWPIEVIRPFATMNKTDVIRAGRDLPLANTVSCLNPALGKHCGRCNKCGERRSAFRAAGIDDPAEYAS